VAGGIFALQTLAFRNWGYKIMTLIAFFSMTGYLLIMYFVIDYNLPKDAIYVPIFLRSFGAILVPITFLTAVFNTIPFKLFFQALNMTTIITACCGPLLGATVINQLFKVAIKKNELFLASTFDAVNPQVKALPMTQLYQAMEKQATLVSMKEIYGWLCMASLLCLALYFFREGTHHLLRKTRS
jgi:hypothetical protein